VRNIYSALAFLFQALIPLAAPFHDKARRWVEGRRNWREKLRSWRQEHSGELIWFHCASLGEFEQGRPVVERIRRNHPQYTLLLTFFSPSGYEIRKHYDRVDGVFYLPADTAAAARDFLDIVQPMRVCFVKYEYWPNYFLECEQRAIPLVMISAILRPDQRFFGWSSFFWKPILQTVDHFFVQDERSAQLLAQLGIDCVTLAGDTRFDRVLEVAASAAPNETVSNWAHNSNVLIAGSTWPDDEEVLHTWWNNQPETRQHWKLLLVPHEIGESHLAAIQRMWPEAVRWSQRANHSLDESRVLIFDEIGHLSALYRYARLAWIGGGFGVGIHNTLEPAAWKLPILFGPKHEKFQEALKLVAIGAARAAQSKEEGVSFLMEWTTPGTNHAAIGAKAGEFVRSGCGATDRIMSYLDLH
jgi:3-deoxy-D-manno-octulosonic-acid transferase